MKMQIKLFLMGLLFVLVLVACGTSDSAGETAESEIESSASLNGTSWILQEFGPEGELKPLLPDTSVTLMFADGRISGTATCNTYFADFTQSGDTLDFGPIGSTRMACLEPITQQENEFLAAMATVKQYIVAEGLLTLPYNDGILVFATAPAEGETAVTATPEARPEGSSLSGTSWVLESSGSADNQTAVLPNTELTLNFDYTQINGHAGCNSYFADATINEDGSLTFGLMGSTLMACLDNDVMQQESDFLAALAQATRYTVAGNQLTLHVPDGSLTFIAANQ